MTTRPELRLGRHLLPGIIAVALFAALAAITVRSSFPPVTGFPADAAITAEIGHAMFNLDGTTYRGEGLLVAFIVVAFVLDAALEGAVLLARREVDGEVVTALLATRGEGNSGPSTHGSETETPPGSQNPSTDRGGGD